MPRCFALSPAAKPPGTWGSLLVGRSAGRAAGGGLIGGTAGGGFVSRAASSRLIGSATSGRLVSSAAGRSGSRFLLPAKQFVESHDLFLLKFDSEPLFHGQSIAWCFAWKQVRTFLLGSYKKVTACQSEAVTVEYDAAVKMTCCIILLTMPFRSSAVRTTAKHGGNIQI